MRLLPVLAALALAGSAAAPPSPADLATASNLRFVCYRLDSVPALAPLAAACRAAAAALEAGCAGGGPNLAILCATVA